MTKLACYFGGTILATSLVLSAPALAQSATAPDAAPDTAAEIGEIVVTAQKRPELASKTALSVSAVTGSDLKAAGVNSVLTLTNVVPSAQISQANGVQITIRGVSSTDGTEKGDPSAAFLIDGVYVARQQSLSGAFFDLDRVEVLRGPQGTLYGRNATAGVVNVISNRPTSRFEGALSGELSNYDTQRAEGMINIPITDTLSIRAAGAYNKHDSYLVNPAGVSRRLGFDQDDAAARVSALWKFGDARQGSVYLVADYSHQGGVGPMPLRAQDFFTGQVSTNPVYYDGSSRDQRTVRYPTISEGRQDNQVYGLTGEFNYDFGKLGLTYLGSYRVFDRDMRRTQAFPKSNSYPDDYINSTNEAVSHELRLATTGDGPVDAVLGAYYFREETKDATDLLPNFAGYALYGFSYPSVVGASKAVFGQATWRASERLRLTGGLRYSHDLKSRVGITIGQQGSTTLDPALYTILAINNARRTFSKVTWKIGADFDLTERVMAYANISTGYKAGGFNDGCAAGSPSCASPTVESRLFYDPEELTAYEAGVKGRYFDGALRLNLTGFVYDYSNLQLTSQQEPPAPPGSLTLNAGKARIKGVEAEAILTPGRNNRFNLSAAFLDATYRRYRPTLTTNFAGRDLDNSPSAVIVAGYTRTIPLASGASIDAHAETRYSSSYVVSDFGIPAQFEQPSYTKSNVSVTYNAPDDRWYVQAFGKNLENEITFSGYQSGRIFISEPRLYGVRAGMKF